MDDERQLVEEVIQGLPGAAERFHDRYHRLVNGTLRRAGLSPEQVDDLYQDVWEKLWRGNFAVLQNWNRSGSFGAYLRRITLNMVTDSHRSEHGRVDPPVAQSTQEDSSDGNPPSVQARARRGTETPRRFVSIDDVEDGDPDPSFALFSERHPLASSAPPDGGMPLRRLGTKLVGAIAELSESCQERIVMRFFEDLDYEEMADKLGSTVDSVRARVCQCIRELRVLLRSRWGLVEFPL